MKTNALAYMLWISVVLMTGCRCDNAVTTNNEKPALNSPSSSPAAASSPASAATRQPASKPPPKPTVPPLAVPDVREASRCPSALAWREGKPAEVLYGKELGCKASVLREWLRVRCKIAPLSPAVNRMTVISDKGVEKRIRVHEIREAREVWNAFIPVVRGVDAKVQVEYDNEDWGKRILSVRFLPGDKHPFAGFDRGAATLKESPMTLAQAPGENPHAGRMRRVPAGKTDKGEKIDSFLLDETEVTFWAWQGCVQSGACPPPTGGLGCAHGFDGVNPLRPMSCVTWEEAAAYCKWAGKRLPTEREWWRAYHGTDKRVYPWGRAPKPAYVCTSQQHEWQHKPKKRMLNVACRVGIFPKGKSQFGQYDMVGNVAEWVESSGKKGSRMALGGSFQDVSGASDREAFRWMMTEIRHAYPANTRSVYVGFRCAK